MGWGSGVVVSCDVGHRLSSDSELLCCGIGQMLQLHTPGLGTSVCCGCGPKKQKKKKKMMGELGGKPYTYLEE